MVFNRDHIKTLGCVLRVKEKKRKRNVGWSAYFQWRMEMQKRLDESRKRGLENARRPEELRNC